MLPNLNSIKKLAAFEAELILAMLALVYAEDFQAFIIAPFVSGVKVNFRVSIFARNQAYMLLS